MFSLTGGHGTQGGQMQVADPTPAPPPPPPLLPPQPPHAQTHVPRSPLSLRRPGPPSTRKSTIGKLITASTPNLRGLYHAVSGDPPSKQQPVPPLPSLQRKGSHAALTSSSLAAVPDASESYAITTLNDHPSQAANSNSNTNTPTGKMAPSPFTSRPGAPPADDLAPGDSVEVPGNMRGTVRFVGTVQGKKGVFAGVELHPEFASRGKNNGDVDGTSYFTTSIDGAGIFLPLNKAIKRDTPPNSATSSFPMTPASATANGLKAGNQNSTNFTPGTPSAPQLGKPTPGARRASSPQGKKPPRPSLGRPESPMRKLQITPGARPSMGTPSKSMPRYAGSPTQTKFSQSVRGPPPTPGDPAKRGMLQPSRNFSLGPRSNSAMSGPSAGFVTDEESVPVGNGMPRSGSALRARGPSRQSTAQDEEIERLRAELADRDRQLREQTATLTDMESSLTEVQTLMEQAELPPPMPHPPARSNSLDDKDTAQLRVLLREKNEKIAMLTAEFDAHRADFRSTIDTLELASTETERVYEKRIEELMQDIQHIQERTSDVDAVAQQLRQLEELVQELEEGLEDARRGEAEARGEVEFLRGEVERTRAELRREREKAAGGTHGTNGMTNGDHSALFKDLEQKEDEIRGLKAIIHSLSSNSVPGEDRPPVNTDDTAAREKLEREVAELRALLDTKKTHEEELEHELETLRRGSAATTVRDVADASSTRNSHDTVVVNTEDYDARSNGPRGSQQKSHHSRVRTLDTMPESDGMSSITEHSGLWCELCETAGHDILTCTNMFGGQKSDSMPTPPSKPVTSDGHLAPIREDDNFRIAPLSPRLMPPSEPPSFAAPKSIDAEKPKGPPPNLMDPGPVAGKESGVIDPDAWCALCEKDGHTSVDCPFEDAF